MDKEVLKIKLHKPKPRKATVTSIETSLVERLEHSPTKLIVFATDSKTGKQLTLQEAWIQKGNKKVVKSMWINPEATTIARHSNIGHVMDYYDLEKVEDFIGKEIDIFPDHNNYLVIAACPIDSSVFKQEIDKEDLY